MELFQFTKLYELSDEPERKEFLNKYQAFMRSQGNATSDNLEHKCPSWVFM